MNSEISYYGVFIPSDYNKQIDNDSCDPVFSSIHVYTEKEDALKIVKQSKKARFKVFKTRGEAENFALNGSEQVHSELEVKNVIVGEKPIQFRGPTSQDLVKLRKMIENGDIELFKKTIWDNPRYLISSGDTPSILKEGYRYNSLHVAAISLNASICDVILQTVSSPEFIQLLYGEDNLEICQERANILLDLYLNTPDKGLNETPLHFAVKYGGADCVEVLTSYVQCDKNLKNQYGLYPKDIICQRCTKDDPVLRKRIATLLEERYYVPVYRSEDGVTVPQIGAPFSPASPPQLNHDPISPRVEIHAYAGPMKLDEAIEFRKKWKTPPRLMQSSLQRRTQHGITPRNPFRQIHDPEKGLEHIGRELAREQKIEWKEYWPFLETFIDLTTPEGLNILEEHIGRKYKNVVTQIYTPPEKFEKIIPKFEYESDTENDVKEIVSPMTDLCRAFKNCTITDNSTNCIDRQKIFRISNNNHDDENLFTNNPNISPYLCVEKSLQVFATRIYNILINTSLDNLTIY
ncbi:ankyrin repeat and LEM domain-containing protein 2 homolog [Chrysoperla carnea]|uniref:ankyrin repeat and LEM domain-containing protein 2 homolog n=1 Tax=Chrysoperla carnea TaxID=189513 RepID=UPI001D096AD5|nr:ankyrin repeat and LEM domain-containing protein 2 homolog [Chrysoperla carnea]